MQCLGNASQTRSTRLCGSVRSQALCQACWRRASDKSVLTQRAHVYKTCQRHTLHKHWCVPSGFRSAKFDGLLGSVPLMASAIAGRKVFLLIGKMQQRYDRQPWRESEPWKNGEPSNEKWSCKRHPTLEHAFYKPPKPNDDRERTRLSSWE